VVVIRECLITIAVGYSDDPERRLLLLEMRANVGWKEVNQACRRFQIPEARDGSQGKEQQLLHGTAVVATGAGVRGMYIVRCRLRVLSRPTPLLPRR
jgi:hypothetical protein